MIEVVNALRTPTARTTELDGAAHLFCLENCLHFHSILPELRFYDIQVHIFYVWSCQIEIVFILAIKPQRELAFTNTKILCWQQISMENLGQK